MYKYKKYQRTLMEHYLMNSQKVAISLLTINMAHERMLHQLPMSHSYRVGGWATSNVLCSLGGES